MSEYTPTTDEVREDFAYPWEGFKQNREGRLAAFDRWLAQVKAEALRDAAVALDNCTEADVNNAIGQPSPTYSHSDRYADVRWLELRADQIQEGQE